MDEIRTANVVVENVMGLGVNILATRSVEE